MAVIGVRVQVMLLMMMTMMVAVVQGLKLQPGDLTHVMEQEARGEKLIKLGTNYKNPVLKLIGQAFLNFEVPLQRTLCEVMKCSPWGEWSNCSAMVSRSFGSQRRERQCWYNRNTVCGMDGAPTTETDCRMCEGGPDSSMLCRKDYTLTPEKLCIKTYELKKSQPAAQKHCQQDGGHLMNPDNKERWSYLFTLATPRIVWLDGTRTKPAGPWNYRVGNDPDKKGLSFWGPGEPTNQTGELCKLATNEAGSRVIKDNTCQSKFEFICEIRIKI